MPPRPRTVTVAVLTLALSFVPGLATWIFTGRWDLPSTWFLALAICALLWLNLTALCRGLNWVRWLNLLLIAVGLLALRTLFAVPSNASFPWVPVSQTFLQAVTLICLLLPSSSQWYSQVTEVRRLRKRAAA